jgi:hypothetical protein
MNETPTKPVRWSAPSSSEVTAAIERERDLFERWRSAQTEAQRALEAIASAQRQDQDRRAAELAAGREDPGAKSTAKLEKEAEAAAERRDVLGSAFAKAHVALLEVADDAEEEWAAAAAEELEAAESAIREALGTLEDGYGRWRAARGELALAIDREGRRRGKAPRSPDTSRSQGSDRSTGRTTASRTCCPRWPMRCCRRGVPARRSRRRSSR